MLDHAEPAGLAVRVVVRGVDGHRAGLLDAWRPPRASFAWLELAAVGLAFILYARHATDGERIALEQGRLVVELENGGTVERAEFLQHQVRVEPQASDRSLIEVSGQGRSVRVGRYVRPELRAALAREIRMALRGA